MTPSIAAGRAGKARCSSTRMCEFAPARARREAQGSRANRMLARPSCPAPMALVTFPERKVTRAVGRRGKRHGRRTECRIPPPWNDYSEFPAGGNIEGSDRAAQRGSGRRKLRESREDCRADAGDVESCFGEQLLAAAVFEEHVRQAEVQHGHFDAM